MANFNTVRILFDVECNAMDTIFDYLRCHHKVLQCPQFLRRLDFDDLHGHLHSIDLPRIVVAE